MNRLTIPSSILLVCLIAACVPTPQHYTDLEARVVDVMDAQSILIQVNHGQITILESVGVHVEVGGQVLLPDELEYEVSSTQNQVSIKVFTKQASLSNLPLRVEIRIPRQMQVSIETDSASVSVRDYQGDLEAASTSGDITVEKMTGTMTLRSNRGNISVRESSGVISMVGNYGALTVKNVHGETALSTIMGNVVFDGLIQADDTVRLEADHGPVSVHLDPDSAFSLQVQSTSGDVTCLLPYITATTRACDGEIHSNGGMLSIRTVSGAVTLQLIP
jgi:hypothetical protein